MATAIRTGLPTGTATITEGKVMLPLPRRRPGKTPDFAPGWFLCRMGEQR